MRNLNAALQSLSSNFARHVLNAVRSARLVDLANAGIPVREGLTHPPVVSVGLYDVAQVWSAQYRLSPAELQILVAAAEGKSRKELRVMRNVAASTLKRQVFTLIRKTGDASLLHAVARLLRQTLDIRSKSQRSRQRR